MTDDGRGIVQQGTLITCAGSIRAGVLHTHTLIASLLQSACLVGHCTSAVFLLHNPDIQQFVLSVLDENARLSARVVSLDSSSIAYRAFSTKTVQVSNEVPHTDSSVKVPRNLAAVPVSDGFTVWGVLELFDSKNEATSFSKEDLDAVLYLAEEAAASLSVNAQSGAMDFFPLVAEDAVTLDLVSVINSLSQTQSPVLLLGEEGSGRCAFARYLCAQSGSVHPFIHLECKKGLESLPFDACSKKQSGFLFFDEVSYLTQEMQETLLNFMSHSVNQWRVLASSSVDLEEAVSKGSFLPQLYHRLSVLPVNVPPLRQRPKDLVLLAERFVRSESRALGKRIPSLSDEAKAVLTERQWEGNLHELQLTVKEACSVCKEIILPQDLAPSGSVHVHSLDLHQALTEFKKQHVQAVLDQTGGNQTEAARLLGVQRTYVSKLMAELGLRK